MASLPFPNHQRAAAASGRNGRLLALGLLVTLAFHPAFAVEPRELGGGLTFVRLAHLDEAVPKPEGPTILDLRYAQLPDPARWPDLQSALRQAGPLRLVLLDDKPPEPLVALLAQRDASVLTLGPRSLKPAPDFAIDVDPVADRAAFDALERTGDVAAVAGPQANKERFDEAALIRARAAGGGRVPVAAPRAAADAAQQKETAAAAPADRLLQHAIRLVRGLQALGRA